MDKYNIFERRTIMIDKNISKQPSETDEGFSKGLILLIVVLIFAVIFMLLKVGGLF